MFNQGNKLYLMDNDFRYMKFIYLHCGEETNLKDLAAKKTTELVVENRT